MSGSGTHDAFHPTLPSSTLDILPSSQAHQDPISPSRRRGSTSLALPQPASFELQDLTSPDPNLHSDSDDEEDASDERARLVQPNSARDSDSTSGDEAEDASTTHMNRKSHSRRATDESPALGDESPDHQNGNMSQPLEHRRKHNPTANDERASADLLGRSSYSLQEEDDLSKEKEGGSYGFSDLPLQDRRNFLMLVLLYFLQGIPMGLAGGSVPFLLKSPKYGVSYGSIGVFSLASYPYSLKLLWSPIVDAIWSRRIGRRKSWILPVQVLSGLGMLWLGARAETMMEDAGSDGGAGIWGFTGWWFFLVFTCATQDIAVDGWAITVLSQKHLAYASTAQTVGLTGGSFLSFTVFLAFSDPHFANKWFRAIPPPGQPPSDVGLWTLGGYLTFWGWTYLAVTLGLALLKREDKTKERDSVMEVYRSMLGVLKLKTVQTIICIHLIAKIGFQANDGVTMLKLLDKGFGQDNMSLVVLIDFPFELSLGYYAGKWSSEYPPMHLWCWAFIGKLIAAALGQVIVMIYPAAGVTTWYLITVIIGHIFSTFMGTVMFVAVAAFHAKIADPLIGGTYMTLLATVSNLGGTFPRFFVLKAVEYFTRATCFPSSPPKALKGDAAPITSPFSCGLDADKFRCTQGGGDCRIEFDGYYIMNVVCVLVGAVTFVMYIRPKALYLQSLPLRSWRLAEGR